MKKVMIIVGTLVGLILLLLLALPYLLDLNRFKDQYIPIVEQALNRKVEVSDIQLMWFPKLGLQLTDTKIVDDPTISDTSFVTVARVDLAVKWRALLQRRVEVSSVTVYEPVIKILRTKEGILNIATLGGKKSEERASRASSIPLGGPLSVLAIFGVEQLMLSNGTLQYEDLADGAGKIYSLEQLVLNTESVKLDHVAKIQVQGILNPYSLPVTFDGSVGPLRQTLDLDQIDTKLGIGNARIHANGHMTKGVAQLEVTSTTITPADLPIEHHFTKPVQITDLIASVQASRKGSSPERSSSGSLQIKPFRFNLKAGESTLQVSGQAIGTKVNVHGVAPVIRSVDLPVTLPFVHPVEATQIEVRANVNGPQVSVNSLTGEMFQGLLSAEGSWDGDEAPRGVFHSNGTFRQFDVEEAQKILKPTAIRLTGTGKIDWALQGSLSQGSFPRLTGRSKVQIRNGELVGIDLLQRIEQVLKLDGVLSARRGVTSFEKFEGDILFEGEQFPVKKFILQGMNNDFLMQGDGVVRIDQTVSLNGTLRLGAHLSERIIQKLPVAKIALQEDELVAPFIVDGTLGEPRVRLDFGVIQKQVQEKVGQAVKEILKGDNKNMQELLKKGKSLFKGLFGK